MEGRELPAERPRAKWLGLAIGALAGAVLVAAIAGGVAGLIREVPITALVAFGGFGAILGACAGGLIAYDGRDTGGEFLSHGESKSPTTPVPLS